MNDNRETARLQFDALRAEIDAGLSRIEKQGGGIEDAAAQLVKIGVVLSLAAVGPTETLQGIFSQLQQLGAIYPNEAATAEALRNFPAVEGSA